MSNTGPASDGDTFRVKPELARHVRRLVIAPLIVLALFTLLVVFAYDFAGEADSPTAVKVLFYGSILGTYAVLTGIALVEWRKAPPNLEAGHVTVSAHDITVDFGNRAERIGLQDIGSVVSIAPPKTSRPQALLFAASKDLSLSQRDHNRVLHKIGSRWARLHVFKKSTVLPLHLFGEDQIDLMIDTIDQALMRSHTERP